MAYTNLDYLEERSKVMPRAQFFLETCKNILDTLRSNSKLLDFYNDTARKVFTFCNKYKSKQEYKRISETLHSHFNQIVKFDKLGEHTGKIPYPIKLDDDKQVSQVLTIRKEQLELALFMKEWTDAHKTSNNIYELMKKGSRKTEQQMKEIYSEFFGHLSEIFWESKLYLFHTYAMQNVMYLTKSLKNFDSQLKKENNDKFVLAALSIPLVNKLSNFERLQFHYVPQSMKEFVESNLIAKEDLLDTAKMLQVDGFPSRKSIIHYIEIENIQLNAS